MQISTVHLYTSKKPVEIEIFQVLFTPTWKPKILVCKSNNNVKYLNGKNKSKKSNKSRINRENSVIMG